MSVMFILESDYVYIRLVMFMFSLLVNYLFKVEIVTLHLSHCDSCRLQIITVIGNELCV